MKEGDPERPILLGRHDGIQARRTGFSGLQHTAEFESDTSDFVIRGQARNDMIGERLREGDTVQLIAVENGVGKIGLTNGVANSQHDWVLLKRPI